MRIAWTVACCTWFRDTHGALDRFMRVGCRSRMSDIVVARKNLGLVGLSLTSNKMLRVGRGERKHGPDFGRGSEGVCVGKAGPKSDGRQGSGGCSVWFLLSVVVSVWASGLEVRLQRRAGRRLPLAS